MDKLFSQRQWAKQEQIAKLQAERERLIQLLQKPGAPLAFTRKQLASIDLTIQALLDEK